ncbi:MAG: hypothetical protein DRP55_03995 [Spirochaetes bacterium]|nr:MAG: hypothetical protein DRP55_03995 [Spirochaetota bacterium]
MLEWRNRMRISEFSIPTKIEFGIDSLARLGHFVKDLGGRAILISDNVMRETGILNTVENILRSKGIIPILYDGIFPVADSSIIDEVTLIARKSRANVAIGVGSSRVCNIAKITAFLCENNGDIIDYIHGREGNGKHIAYIEIPAVFREVYALSGSAFLTDAYDQTNKVISTEGLGTDILIVDPAIMSEIPLDTAVYIALDILTLSIEGYISLKVNPLVEPILLRGIELVYYNLSKYVKNPHDVGIREQICTAGLFIAISNIVTGFGIAFSLSMGMNGKNRISKPVSSSILLPYIIDYNLNVVASRFAKIARVMGRDINNLEETQAALKAIEGIKEFKDSLGIKLKKSLKELGLKKDDLAEAAEVAVRFEDINSIPRRASFENLMEILEKAY